MIRQLPFILLIFLFLNNDLPSDQFSTYPQGPAIQDTIKNYPVILKDDIGKITDLRPGDILVKANHNWLPGTAQIFGGKGFGHAVLVVGGAQDTNIIQLLRKTIIFESHSRDVPPDFQIRKAPAYLPGSDFRYASITFGPQNFGYCYRLRPALSESQIRQLIGFVMSHDNGVSCWRALKHFDLTPGNNSPGQSDHWYCSLLLWQGFYTLFGIDLDPNAGVMVYPNDLIASPFFDNKPGGEKRRIRF
jgi:hypothetical protein